VIGLLVALIVLGILAAIAYHVLTYIGVPAMIINLVMLLFLLLVVLQIAGDFGYVDTWPSFTRRR
jgi:hypothetical protein